MKITFDAAKDAANLEKHGISLAAVDCFDFADALVMPDRRHDYGEDRFVALGLLKQRVYVVVFAKRDDAIRIISLRKANLRERKRYGRA
jgi:uncharacterized DUF497 family protein